MLQNGLLSLFFCGGEKSRLLCRVDGPSVSEVNHVVFTDSQATKTLASVKSRLCTHHHLTRSHMHTFIETAVS